MAYYYLISSLPMLKSNLEMPMSYGQFLYMCKDSLKGDTYKMLEQLSLLSDDGPLVSEWAGFYRSLCEELTYQRNLRLGRKAELPSQREDTISKLVSAAMSSKNPLEAERLLLAFEFEKLDELVGTHYFDDYALFGYALKLKLLERSALFEREQGKSEFSRIVGKLENEIMSMEQE